MEGFPLSQGALERYRLATRKRAPAGQVGAHLLRRKGQSLEFHDFVPYHPGDDYRHIDWRASARLRRPRELLVRRFQAEETLTLAISIDNRPSMGLLAEAPKLLLASWLAYAVTAIAAAGGDRVLLHRLFGPSPRSVRIRGKDSLYLAQSYLERLARESVADDTAPELGTLDAWLRPASVWVILTDLYFPDDEQRLARAVTQAQRGLRWVILVDLDNWPHEETVLGRGARRIEGPGLDRRLDVEISERRLDEVRQRIERHKGRFLERTRRGGLSVVRWSWPRRRQVDLAALFRERFQEEPVLRRLFRRRS